MIDVAGFASDHPFILAMLVAGGLVLFLLPLASDLLNRRRRKDPPPDR